MRMAFAYLTALALSHSATALAQQAPEPHLPGALTKAPAWLKADAPFDIDAFLKLPPDEDNAAPLYLDALLEFDPDVAECFPDNAETARRKRLAGERQKRYQMIDEALKRDPNSVPAEKIDALIAEHDLGFRKLAEAQRRPRCVFATGFSIESPIPHVRTTRQVVQIVQLRARRDRERGKFDRPLDDIAAVLRLSRDVRPRGPLTSQLVSIAMMSVLDADVIAEYLAAPGLKGEHCDRLLTILVEHEAAAINPFAEGMKAEYLMERTLIRDLTGRNRDLGPRAAAEAREATIQNLMIQANDPGMKAFLDRLRRMSDDEYSGLIRAFNTFYRTATESIQRPLADRAGRAEQFIKELPPGTDTTIILQLLLPAISSVDVATTRVLAMHRATTCLVALRRWQLTKKTAPKDLLSVVKAAGLPAVPIDPHDGKPLRFVLCDGQPVIYAIGKDLKDDGGRLDSNAERQPGDMLFRLKSTR